MHAAISSIIVTYKDGEVEKLIPGPVVFCKADALSGR